MNSAPLSGIKIVDFSQFLSGPMATLKLADMGAEVIKIERKGVGDICRTLYLTNETVDGESTLFHAINRNKKSIDVDLKDPEDLAFIKQLIKSADVMVQNFRPGIMDKYGLDYISLSKDHLKLIYASVSGYGSDTSGEFYSLPGQDLLAQSISGMTTGLNGTEQSQPKAQGLALADMMAGNHLAEGILAALIQLQRAGVGSQIEVSLFESLMDGMMVPFSEYLNTASSEKNGTRKKQVTTLLIGSKYYLLELDNDQLLTFTLDNAHCFVGQNQVNNFVVLDKDSEQLIDSMTSLNIAFHAVHSWDYLFKENPDYRNLLTQKMTLQSGDTIHGTRLPIRFNGEILTSKRPAPHIGEHTNEYKELF